MISAVLYACPVHPGKLFILPGTTQHESVRLTHAHAEAIRVFRETVELEKVLINLTCSAMAETYYKERVNPHTSTITEPISIFDLAFYYLWRH